jgi:hypothetical protein
MASATPVWTDNVSVIAAATVAAGNKTRGTIDLRSKFGAFLFVRLGRKGSTAPGSGIQVQVRRVLNNDGAGGIHPGASIPLAGSTTTGQATTVNADSASGQAVLNVASVTNFAAGDVICIYDSGFSRLEFQRVSKVSGSTLVLDDNLGFTHTAAQADNVTRIADVFAPVWLAGGSLWELVVDYGGTGTGADYVVEAKAQTYDSDSIA